MPAKPLYQLELELDFYVCLHQKHCALYRKLRVLRTVLSMAASGTAIAAFADRFGVSEAVGAAGAALVFLLSVIDLAVNFSEKGFKHERLRGKYAALKADLRQHTEVTLATALAKIQVDDSAAINALRYPAYREVLRTHGHTPSRGLGPWEWAINILS